MIKVYVAVDGVAVGEREIDDKKPLLRQFDNAKAVKVFDPRESKEKKTADLAEGDVLAVTTRKHNGK